MRIRWVWINNTGAMAITIALLLMIFVAIVALVIDYGFGLVVRQQLHHAADAAALHATRQLGVLYEGLPDFAAQQNFVLDGFQKDLLRTAVLNAAADNAAGGKAITIDQSDIRIGQWDPATRTLTPTDVAPTGVEVLARRDATANGPINTFFASILGIDTLNLLSVFQRNGTQEIPTAALTGVGSVEPGELDLPIGISEEWFRNKALFCDQDIRFYPTNDPIGCAGWTTFNLSPASASTLSNDVLQEMLAGTFVSPEATAGTTQFEFVGGNVASALPELVDLFNQNKNAAGEWEVFVMVYESTDCSNPSGTLTIVGFASVTITNVLAPPDGQLLEGSVKCDLVQPNTRGGGANFGTLGSIPGLVK